MVNLFRESTKDQSTLAQVQEGIWVRRGELEQTSKGEVEGHIQRQQVLRG